MSTVASLWDLGEATPEVTSRGGADRGTAAGTRIPEAERSCSKVSLKAVASSQAALGHMSAVRPWTSDQPCCVCVPPSVK